MYPPLSSSLSILWLLRSQTPSKTSVDQCDQNIVYRRKLNLCFLVAVNCKLPLYVEVVFKMSRKKHQSDEIYLIGNPVREIQSRKLPTNRQTLQLFFHKHRSSNLSIRHKATEVAEEIKVLWNRADIPTSRVDDVTNKIVKLHNEWKKLHRNRLRKSSPTQQQKELRFGEKMDILFHIAVLHVEDVLNTTQRDFLHGQRGQNRRGFICSSNDDKDIDLEESDGNIEISGENTNEDNGTYILQNLLF